ncbi:type IV toxin-antitoxin system AbiEi family antitoxin [Mycobacterium sp. SMC-4]|uniref:type IV toxin-antitoxin system AbiEi family antitoxin n=1 Tax=Mycobacterium sp. SMC-4 TaxID=2857059 RepID=UPI0021B283BE|nr:type IV toxin-antitoxin system AbiEi family antitoxin [Mycobacterium sp. SMC-4]UXA19336.1 type IV toxin-antitoxin system AbiEi family antitoxin [Mycobacterium sp. SMC-4]
MTEPFIGSEALRAGRLTRHRLRTDFQPIYPDVYLRPGDPFTAATRAQAAWLWTRREGVVAGRSAAALHGAKWTDPRWPADLLWTNRRAPRGVRVWSDRLADDEIQVCGGITVTTPERTALDIACRYPPLHAVTVLDALTRATRLKAADVDVLTERYKGRRDIRRARESLDLLDGGAESPQETRIRLMVIRNGFPRPETQIPVYDDFGALVAVLDMGWKDLKIAIDYEGDHHRSTREEFNKGIRRHDAVTELGWDDIRVTALDSEGGVIGRLADSWRRRLCG